MEEKIRMSKLFIILVVVFYHTALQAQEIKTYSGWSVGTSITYPIAAIYLVHINYALDDRHELFFGPCFQNFKHESFTVNAYTLLLGYRYFLWKRLHVEAEIYPAYNNIYSNVTQTYFPGFEMWGEFKVGYQFNFFKDKLYVQLAPGIGFGFFRANKPPNFDEEIVYPIFTPQIMLGLRI